MKLYAVRMIEDHQPVGFFWCRRSELEYWIDMVCDPALTEYQEVRKSSGIMWDGNVALRMGTPPFVNDEDGESPELDELFREASFEGGIDHVLYGYLNDWRPILEAAA